MKPQRQLNRSLRLVAPAMMVASLAACSWFGEKPPEYIDSAEVPPLSVPDGLDAPRYASPIMITAPEMRTPTGDELNPSPPRVASTHSGR